jgi:hypothetical protein
MNKTKLFVATPMYGGMCTGNYALGLLNMAGICSRHGIELYYAHMQNESLITRARNSLANDFLNTDATHLMFIDADIGFNPQDIVSMVNANKDIICGMYPKKEINWFTVAEAVIKGVDPKDLADYTGSFVVNLVGGASEQKGKLYEPMQIENGGTGFMLIKREVFEALKSKVLTYTNDMMLVTETGQQKKIIHEFFATSIDEQSNRLLSEDYHFCKLARKHGFEIYAAPWAKLVHSGTYNFSGKLIRT